MGIEILEPLEISNGIAMIILNTISIALGLMIASKYVKYKNRTFLLVGFTWIALSCPWWPGAISFILITLNQPALTPEAYFIIGNLPIPIAVVTWLAAFTKLYNPDKQKLAIILGSISSIVFVIIFFYFLVFDISQIGALRGTNLIDVQYSTVVVVYYLLILVLLLITGYLFAKQSMKSDNPEIQLKGKLLLIAFILYVIGAMLDSSVPLDYWSLILFRGFELAAAFVFYMGFVLPNWMKKRLIKEKT